MRSLSLAGLFALMAVPALAQGPAGTWKANADPAKGGLPFSLVFDFAVTGNKVTGTVSNEFMPKFRIEEGVVKGNELSFKLRTQLVTFLYKGPVKGDTLTLKSTVVEERPSADQGQTLGGALRSVSTITATREKAPR